MSCLERLSKLAGVEDMTWKHKELKVVDRPVGVGWRTHAADFAVHTLIRGRHLISAVVKRSPLLGASRLR
jgi:hypothetical protein